nr:uncharacterized protein LOC110363775 [Columba livia]
MCALGRWRAGGDTQGPAAASSRRFAGCKVTNLLLIPPGAPLFRPPPARGVALVACWPGQACREHAESTHVCREHSESTRVCREHTGQSVHVVRGESVQKGTHRASKNAVHRESTRECTHSVQSMHRACKRAHMERAERACKRACTEHAELACSVHRGHAWSVPEGCTEQTSMRCTERAHKSAHTACRACTERARGHTWSVQSVQSEQALSLQEGTCRVCRESVHAVRSGVMYGACRVCTRCAEHAQSMQESTRGACREREQSVQDSMHGARRACMQRAERACMEFARGHAQSMQRECACSVWSKMHGACRESMRAAH